jgi:hypothetical protein
MKATVVKEKKPHHFLDYLFLATDREKRMMEAHPEIDTSMFPNAQPLMLNFAPSKKIIHQVEQQPTNTLRRGASSKITKSNVSSEQIFRRGKGQGYKKAALLVKLAERERANDRERRLLQEVAPRGIENSPTGCFDGYEKLGFDDIDERIFDQVTKDFNSLSPGAFVNGEQPNSVSFESLPEVPFDESLDNYVLNLIAGV